MVEVENRFCDNITNRDEFIKLASCSFIIPEEYRMYFAKGIKQYANKPLKDETVNKMVAKEQSFAQFINSLYLEQSSQRPFDFSFAHWKGFFAEWVTCLEYNSLKNKGNVIMTIVNPDTTSKADLLHLVKINDEYKVVPGPDVKTGLPEYVLSSYEKLLEEKIEIPFVDAFGLITTYEKDLTKGQRARLNRALEAFPSKKPLPGLISMMDYRRLMTDYLAYVKTGRLPSERTNGDFKLPKTKNMIRQLVDMASKHECSEIKTWDQFKLDLSHKEHNVVSSKIESDTTNSVPLQQVNQVRLKGIDEFQSEPIINKKTVNQTDKILLKYIADEKKKNSSLSKLFNFAKTVSKGLIKLTAIGAIQNIEMVIESLTRGSHVPSRSRVTPINNNQLEHTQCENKELLPPNNLVGIGSPKSPHDRSGHWRNGKIWVSPTRVNKHKDKKDE